MHSPYSCQWARALDLVELLTRTGHHQVRKSGNNYWYLSPLREEKTASFHVNIKLNRWYDFGLGKGGNTLDFAQQFFSLEVAPTLQKLKDIFGSAALPNFFFQQQKTLTDLAGEKEKKIAVISATDLTSQKLLDYGRGRGIPEDILKRFCRQVSFSLYDKQYEAIGFPNDSGGWELRNTFFKGSSSPKSVSFFTDEAVENLGSSMEKSAGEKGPLFGAQSSLSILDAGEQSSPAHISVFEGFFDFLSYRTLLHRQQGTRQVSALQPLQPRSNFLILNSLSFFQTSRSLMEKHASIFLFLDRGMSGMKATENAFGWSKQYVDSSRLYQDFDDLNEWFSHLQQPGQQQRQRRGRHV